MFDRDLQRDLVVPGDFRGLVDLVHRQLREEILAGTLAVGAPLRQRQLASQLGVSREPVRQALRILENEGLLEARPRRTPVVAGISKKVIADVYEVRGYLDSLVASRAASDPARSDHLVPRLAQIIEQAKGADRERSSVFAELDASFHRAIYEASGNDFALNIFDHYSRVIRRVFSTIAASGWIDHSWGEHAQIQLAIADGDAERVASLSRLHVAAASQRLLTVVGDEDVAGAKT